MPKRQKRSVEERAAELPALIEQAMVVNKGGAGNVVVKAEERLRRIVQRQDVPEDMQRVEIVQSDGPTIEFTGRLLAEAKHEGPDGLVRREIWETRAGNLVAVFYGDKYCTATICASGDHLAVLDAFRWTDVARSMARKLGWSLKVDVE